MCTVLEEGVLVLMTDQDREILKALTVALETSVEKVMDRYPGRDVSFRVMSSGTLLSGSIRIWDADGNEELGGFHRYWSWESLRQFLFPLDIIRIDVERMVEQTLDEFDNTLTFRVV